jgi:pilus assembly protein CpaB
MHFRRIALIVIAALVAGGLILGLFTYMKSADQRALAGIETRSVYVVKTPIAKGAVEATIATSVVLTALPAKTIPAAAVTDLSKLKGLVAGSDMVADEVLLSTKFVDPIKLATGTSTGTTSSALPKGLQQMSLTVKTSQVSGGTVSPGALIGIIAVAQTTGDTPTLPSGGKVAGDATSKQVLDKLLVLSVQGGTTQAAAPQPAASASASPSASSTAKTTTTTTTTTSNGSITITVAVDANQAEKLAWLLTQNIPLYLTIQNADTDDSKSKYTTAKVVFN